MNGVSIVPSIQPFRNNTLNPQRHPSTNQLANALETHFERTSPKHVKENSSRSTQIRPFHNAFPSFLHPICCTHHLQHCSPHSGRSQSSRVAVGISDGVHRRYFCYELLQNLWHHMLQQWRHVSQVFIVPMILTKRFCSHLENGSFNVIFGGIWRLQAISC